MRYINDCGTATHRINVRLTQHTNKIIVTTTRPITPNEEFFFDYGNTYPWTEQCPRITPSDPYITNSDTDTDTEKPPTSFTPRNSHRKIRTTILEPSTEPSNKNKYYYKGLRAKPTGSSKKQTGVYTTKQIKKGTFIISLGTRIQDTEHTRRKHTQMALTNALNWSEPIPPPNRIKHIIAQLSHCIKYDSTAGAVDGHPNIRPHNGIGSHGLAITMLINEPSKSKPNAIFCRDGILIIKDLTPETQIQAYYGPQAEEMRALQGYSLTQNTYINQDNNHHKDQYILPTKSQISKIIQKWTPSFQQDTHPIPTPITNTIPSNHSNPTPAPKPTINISPKPTTTTTDHSDTYWHNNEIGDGRCAAHGCATIISTSITDMVKQYTMFTEHEITKYKNYISHPDHGAQTQEYIDFITSIPSQPNHTDKWIQYCKNTTHALNKKLSNLKRLIRYPSSWQNNPAAQGGDIFKNFIQHHFLQHHDTDVDVITLENTNPLPLYSSPISTHTITQLITSTPALALEPSLIYTSLLRLHNNSIIIFVNTGGHWHTITPLKLLKRKPKSHPHPKNNWPTQIPPIPQTFSITSKTSPKQTTHSPSTPPNKKPKLKTQLTIKQTFIRAAYSKTTPPPPPPPPPPQPPSPPASPTLTTPTPLTELFNAEQTSPSSPAPLTTKTVTKHIKSMLHKRYTHETNYPHIYHQPLIQNIAHTYLHTHQIFNTDLTRITHTDKFTWYSPFPEDKPFGATTGSPLHFLKNKYTWINLSNTHTNIQNQKLAIQAITNSTHPTRILLLTDTITPSFTNPPDQIQTHNLLTLPPHTVTLEQDTLTDHSQHQPPAQLKSTNQNTIYLLLLEHISTPPYHSHNFLRTLTHTLHPTSIHYHPHPHWHNNLTPKQYDELTTTNHKRIHTLPSQLLTFHNNQPNPHYEKDNPTPLWKFPTKESLTLAAFGIGTISKTNFIKHGYDPDVLTKSNLRTIKQLICSTTHHIYKRTLQRENHRKYGAPD